MANLLIVTEDIFKIQTFSGRLGRTYSKIYQEFLKLKLKLIIAWYRSRNQITLLASDNFRLKAIKTLNYDQELARDRLIELKPLAWQLINHLGQIITQADSDFCLFQSIPLIKLWENKLAVKLVYDYFIYLDLIERQLQSKQFDAVVILGNSLQEKLAKFFAGKFKLKLINYSFPGLNFLTDRLFNYFRQREISKKINQLAHRSVKSSAVISPDSKPVLLSIDFPRHLAVLAPVYVHLQSQQRHPIFITDFPNFISYLAHYNLKQPNYLFLTDFLPADYLAEHLKDWQRAVNSIHRQLSNQFKGSSGDLSKFLLFLFFPEVSPVIKYGLILSRLYLTAADNLIKVIKPTNILVTADVRPLELALVTLAKQQHIPSLMVSARTVMFNEEPYRYDQTDYISVTGNHSRRQLLKLGVPARKIRVCGDPRLDELNQQKPSRLKEKIYHQLGIKDLTKSIVLLISFRFNSKLPLAEKMSFIKLAQAAVRQVNNAVLVIKPHPTERRYQLLEELKAWQVNDDVIVTNNSQLELLDLLTVSSVVVQTWSMTGLEAITFNLPLIIVNPLNKNYDQVIPYIVGKGAKEAKNQTQLIKWLKIFTDKTHPQTKSQLLSARRFAREYIKTPDGQVCQRISDLLVKVS